ncbi:MAG: hypothetical protein IPM26_07690 [Saprospiraceae bacterium]|nr:hypothetical protein [Saprospiraceae bacterium]
MSNYISISGPFMNGVRPRSFFADTKDWYRSRLIQSEYGTKARQQRYTPSNPKTGISPYQKELLAMAPWILIGVMALTWLFF